MVFQTAGIEVAPWIPPMVSFVISFFTSMGGISGAFLLLPFQMSFLGYTNPSVSATNHLFNVFAIPSGVYRYCKEGRMIWPLMWLVVAGTLPGVFIGAVVRVKFLPDPKTFKLFAACFMLCIGVKMVRVLLKKQPRLTQKNDIGHRFQEGMTPYRKRSIKQEKPDNGPLLAVNVTHFNLKRLEYEFYGQQFDVSFWGIFALSFIVGIVGGIYGIGGGAVIAPFFVTVFNLPIHTVAGAALMGTFVTSLGAVVFYQIIAPLYPDMSIAPDWFLGFLFGLGGIAGMYLGARCQKFVPAKAIKWMLAGVIVFTSIKYLAAFFTD